MQVKLYRNLNNGKISIMDPVTRLVVGHADSVSVRNAQFVVNETGRQRVLKEKRKNVHAFVTGTLFAIQGFESYRGRYIVIHSGSHSGAKRIVKYNPYIGPYFTAASNGKPVHSANTARVESTGKITAWRAV